MPERIRTSDLWIRRAKVILTVLQILMYLGDASWLSVAELYLD